MKRMPAAAVLATSTLCVFPGGARADTGDLELGLRAQVLAADAPPANDMPGAGLIARYRLDRHWSIGVALDTYSFDYEEPYRWLGIERDPMLRPIDATNDSTVLSAWVERRYGNGGPGWSVFWTAGAGYAFLNTEDVTGPTADGGMFDITTDVSDELQLHGSLGFRRRFARTWAIEGALLVQYQATDYDIRDRVSGATGHIGSQTVPGVALGVSHAFDR